MYRSSNNQINKNYQLHSEGGHHSSKNYLNYINFQANPPSRNSQNQANRQPDQVATYTININQHPQPRSGTPNSANSINRTPYINPGNDPQMEQNNQSLTRNSSNKEPFASRKSQQLTANHNQYSNAYNKTTPHGFFRNSKEQESSSKHDHYASDTPAYMGSPNYSKTMDLGSLRSQQLQNSGHKHHEEDEMKQKLNYLEVLEHTLRQYQKTRSPNELRQLNQDNRLLMLGVFEEINKLKDERSRKTISDNISESDNYSESEHAYSADDKSESRSNSIHSKRRYLEGLSKSREKARIMEKDIEHERRLNQKLTIQYQEEMRKFNMNEQSQLQKLILSIQKQEEEIKNITNLNNEMASKLTHLPFHHEWKIMCGEADGAKKAKIKIQVELDRRRQKLTKLRQESLGKKQAVKSEQTAANQKQQKPYDGTATKKTSNLNFPPPPMTRPNVPQPGNNRGIKQTSLRQSVQDNRSKSSNRYNTSS